MTDYNKYRKEKGISNADMTAALNKEFPKFTKVQSCMVNKPSEYGVCLLPEAEHILIKQFGNGDGLAFCPVKRKKENRKNSHRLTVRINDTLNKGVRILMAELGFDTVQAFLEAALTSMVKQSNGEAEEEVS